MCGSCTDTHPEHERKMFDPHGEWDGWDGRVEVHETWTDWEVNAPCGEVMHVTEESPAPEGVDTVWSVYGHHKNGGVFHIADFEYSDHDGAMRLAYGLERMAEIHKRLHAEIERMTECLEKPVGYINQHDLEILRSTGEVDDVTLTKQPSGYHNAAIYAQD